MTVFESWQDVIDIPEMQDKYPNTSGESDSFVNCQNLIRTNEDWTRGEVQLALLVVLSVLVAIAFAVVVAVDCGRHFAARRLDRIQAQLKAPPLSVFAPPPYTEYA